MKTVLGFIEKVLFVIVACATFIGLYFTAYLVVYGIWGRSALTSSAMGMLLVGSMILAAVLIRLLGRVRYMRLEILADELEQQKQAEGQEQGLYEHLRENVYGK